MKTKINKILAILTCVAIMVSMSVPIMAFDLPDGACCDDHFDDTHDCGSIFCGHDETTHLDECGGVDCACEDCVCEDECECADCECFDADGADCNGVDCACEDCICEDECDCADESLGHTGGTLPGDLPGGSARAMSYEGITPSSIATAATFYARGTSQHWTWAPDLMATQTKRTIDLTQSGSYAVEFLHSFEENWSGSFYSAERFPDNTIKLRILADNIDTSDVSIFIEKVEVTGGNGGTAVINQTLTHSIYIYDFLESAPDNEGYAYDLNQTQLEALGQLAPNQKVVFHFSVILASDPGDGTADCTVAHTWNTNGNGKCVECSESCTHPIPPGFSNPWDNWNNGICRTCKADRRCGIGLYAEYTECGDYEQIGTSQHQCRQCYAGWVNCTYTLDGGTKCVCGRDNPDTGAPAELEGTHSLITRTGKNVIYSLNAATHPFTASGGTAPAAQGTTHVTTTVTAGGSGGLQGINIPASVFSSAQVGDILEIRGRIIDNRLGGGRLAMFNATGSTADGEWHTTADLVSPWTMTFELNATALGGLRLLANRWSGGSDNFTFSIDDLIIHRPATVTVPKYTWDNILSNFFTSNIGAHGTVTVAQSIAGISVSDRANNNSGLGINVAALRDLNPSNSAIVITGYIIGGGGGSWGPRIDVWPDGDGGRELTGTATSLTIPAANTFGAGTAHRLVANGPSLATSFVITNITVGGQSIVDTSGNPGRCPTCTVFAPDGRCTVCLTACTHTAGYSETTGRCAGCDALCSHPGWSNGRCNRCNADRRCGSGTIFQIQAACGPFEQPNTTAHQCRTCWGGHITCTFPGGANCVCGRVSHTHNWVEGVCQNSGCSYPSGQCPHSVQSYDDETNHKCDVCEHTQAHTFPPGRGQCTANGCDANNESGSVVIVHTPCGMCGTVGSWAWGGNADRHWSTANCCELNEEHTFNANGVCKCGAGDTRSPCGMCGTHGFWSWGGNEGSHWSSSGCCQLNAPHFFDANGLCICGRTGTPSTPPSPCGMCGTVGSWRWGGNEDVHWSSAGCCDLNAPHVYNASGVCICGRTGTPGGSATGTPCGMCGVVGPWSWGGNEDVHWAANCNCTGNEPHNFVNGVCKCGRTASGTILAPQDTFREEDFIDAGALIDDLLRAIEAGETPTIDLTQSGNVTIISADVFKAIAESGVDVEVVLPSGFKFTIIASSITDDVGAFDLNIEVLIKYVDTQLETIGGGKVDIPANSIVFRPNFHGEFGFELVFNVTLEQIADAGLDIDRVRLYHVDAVGMVSDKGRPTINDDGTISFSKTHASFYVLSNDPPITSEIGTGIIETVTPETPETPERPTLPTRLEMAEQADNITWILIAISGAAILAAAGVAVVMIRRRRNTTA